MMRKAGQRIITESSSEEIPTISVSQMVEVDRLMIDEYHIALLQMMENAGRALGRLAIDHFFDDKPVGRKVVVLAGPGGNGGGALAAARRLDGWGVSVQCCLAQQPAQSSAAVQHQLAALQKIEVPIVATQDLDSLAPELIIDGLIGYSLRGSPREPVAALIEWANHGSAPILSLDVPSGVDADTGAAPGSAIRAEATLTLALPKTGLTQEPGKQLSGAVYLADIGIPPQLYERIPLAVSRRIFSEHEIIRLW